MIGPLERWRGRHRSPDRPDFAGLLTRAGMPYTQDPAALEGVDMAIVGAAADDLVPDRPSSRYGARVDVAERVVGEILTGIALRRRDVG